MASEQSPRLLVWFLVRHGPDWMTGSCSRSRVAVAATRRNGSGRGSSVVQRPRHALLPGPEARARSQRLTHGFAVELPQECSIPQLLAELLPRNDVDSILGPAPLSRPTHDDGSLRLVLFLESPHPLEVGHSHIARGLALDGELQIPHDQIDLETRTRPPKRERKVPSLILVPGAHLVQDEVLVRPFRRRRYPPRLLGSRGEAGWPLRRRRDRTSQFPPSVASASDATAPT